MYGLGRQPAVLRNFSQRLSRLSYANINCLSLMQLSAFICSPLLATGFHMLWYDFRGFNDAINGFSDDGWTLLNCDGAEDLIISINTAKSLSATFAPNAFSFLGGTLCAKASMLLQVSFLENSF